MKTRNSQRNVVFHLKNVVDGAERICDGGLVWIVMPLIVNNELVLEKTLRKRHFG